MGCFVICSSQFALSSSIIIKGNTFAGGKCRLERGHNDRDVETFVKYVEQVWRHALVNC